MKTNKILRTTTAYLKIAAGAAIYALGFSFLTFPNSIPTGGITGIAMILNHLIHLPVGTMVIIMNIPLFIFAWRKFGLQFMLASLAGMGLSATLVDVLSSFHVALTGQPLLAAVYGGIVMGFGFGLVYSAGGSTGGSDIVAKIFRKRFPYINLGIFLLVLDVLVISSFAVVLKLYDSAMYGIITMYISAKMVDLVLYGVVNTKACYIITDMSQKISAEITEKLSRGVTLLRGEGAWSQREKKVILCVIKTPQIVELRKIVRENDEDAFMVVSDAREVFGEGFMSIHSEL